MSISAPVSTFRHVLPELSTGAAVEKSGELITKHFEKKHFENFLGKNGEGKHKKDGKKQEKREEKQSYSKHEIFRILFDRIKPNSEFDIFLINKVRKTLKMSL